MIEQAITDEQFAGIVAQLWPTDERVAAVEDHRREPAGRADAVAAPVADEHRDPRHPVGRVPGDHRVHRPRRADRGQAEPGRGPRRTGRHLHAVCSSSRPARST